MLTEEQKRKKIVQTKDKLFVPMMMMDGVQRAVADRLTPVVAARHQPGFAVLADEDRAKRASLVADANKKLSDRWKDPQPLPPDLSPKPVVVVSSPAADAAMAYDRYDRRIGNAWRSA